MGHAWPVLLFLQKYIIYRDKISKVLETSWGNLIFCGSSVVNGTGEVLTFDNRISKGGRKQAPVKVRMSSGMKQSFPEKVVLAVLPPELRLCQTLSSERRRVKKRLRRKNSD